MCVFFFVTAGTLSLVPTTLSQVPIETGTCWSYIIANASSFMVHIRNRGQSMPWHCPHAPAMWRDNLKINTLTSISSQLTNRAQKHNVKEPDWDHGNKTYCPNGHWYVLPSTARREWGQWLMVAMVTSGYIINPEAEQQHSRIFLTFSFMMAVVFSCLRLNRTWQCATVDVYSK